MCLFCGLVRGVGGGGNEEEGEGECEEGKRTGISSLPSASWR